MNDAITFLITKLYDLCLYFGTNRFTFCFYLPSLIFNSEGFRAGSSNTTGGGGAGGAGGGGGGGGASSPELPPEDTPEDAEAACTTVGSSETEARRLPAAEDRRLA